MLSRIKSAKGLRSASVYLGANLASAAVPFILLPILVRLISPEEFGQVALFQAMLSVSLAIVGLGTIGAVKRRYFMQAGQDQDEDYAAYVGTILLILIATSLLALGIVALLSSWLMDLTGFGFAMLAVLVGATASRFIVDLRLGDLQIRKQAAPYGITQILLAIANGGLSLAFVWFIWRNAEGRIAGMVIAVAIFALLSLFSLYRAGRIRFDVTRERLRDALNFGVPLIPHTVGMFMLSSIDRFFVAEYSGLATAGIYAAGMQLGFALRILTDSVNKWFQPWLFEKMAEETDRSKQEVVTAIYRLGCFTVLAGAAFALVSPILVRIVLGEAYIAAAGLVPMMVLGMIFHSLYLYQMNILMFAGKTGHLSYVTIIVGVVGVALLFWLTPVYGAWGAAVAVTLGAFLRFLCIAYLSSRGTGLQWRLPTVSTLMGRPK